MSPVVAQQFQLWRQLTRREIAARHKGSHLGMLWNLLNPLLEFAVYATVFGVIFQGRYRVVPDETAASYALGVFLSLTCFRLVTETIGQAPQLITSQPNFVKKVVFPLHLLPLSALGATLYRVGISLTLFLVGFALAGPSFSAYNLWLPLLLIPLVVLACGLAWLLAALGVFLRDIGQLMGVASMVLLYSSCVFYSSEMVAAKSPLLWSILRTNPILHVIEGARRCMLWHMAPSAGSVVYIWVVSIATAAIGYFTFQKLRPAFADVL